MPPHADLPIMAHAEEILRKVSAPASRVVLAAPTGSGKTTQVPRMILEGVEGTGRVIVLQPRRLAARAVANRVAWEMGCEVGSLVGYETRFERKVSRQSRLVFMTDGLFLRRLLRPGAWGDVNTVIIDEFHERSIASDLIAGLVRRAQAGGESVRLLAMSATIDAQRLATALEASLIFSAGRLHPIDIRYGGDVPQMVAGRRGPAIWDVASNALAGLIREGIEGDALVFMPGKSEISRCMESMASCMRSLGEQAEVLPLHGSLEPAQQDRALAPSKKRKIVVATNIAETSLTIEGIRIVIDSGLARVARFDALRDLNALRVEPISASSAAQRAGRAGRTAPGVCVRLWSTASQARKPEFDEPEIWRIEFSESLLTLLSCSVSSVDEFPWIDSPSPLALAHALDVLRLTGAIDERRELTPVGQTMASMAVHPRLARAMLESVTAGCVQECARMCAVAAGRDVLWGNAGVESLEIGESPCDLLVRSRVLAQFMSDRAPAGADLDACREAARTAEDLIRATQQASSHAGAAASVPDCPPSRCLLRAFPDRVGWRPDPLRDVVLIPGRRKTVLDAKSLVRGAGPLLALEIRESPDGSRSVVTSATPLAPKWVEEDCASRFTRTTTERWDAVSSAVIQVEESKFAGVLLHTVERPSRDSIAAGQVLADLWGSGEFTPDSWNEEVTQWIERVRSLRLCCPEHHLLAYDEDDLRVLRLEICAGCTRLKELHTSDCLAAVRGALTNEERHLVDRLVPAAISLPAGRRMRLEYRAGSPPRGKSRIQDFYGLDRTPTVAGGRLPVVLEITGPNNRPLQVTQDLAEFWKTLYPQLRGELRRRYPSHEWR